MSFTVDMTSLSDLCFDPGKKFAALVSQRFGCSVSLPNPPSRKVFRLVASFGRSTVRLNPSSVSLILQACLGGTANDYNVSHLSGWMFGFSVHCKNVGFMVYRLKNFSCKAFSIFFHLWSGGGPNWQKDYDLWRSEQEAEWTLVGSKSKKSFADVVRSNPSLKRPVFLRLTYPLNHVSKFADLSSSVAHFPPEPRSAPKRVLRWLPKGRAITPEQSKALLARSGFQISKSLPP